MKRYTMKEVRKHTGLNRRQIFDYKDTIKPITAEGEYKEYDEAGLKKLMFAAQYRKLGLKPAEINRIFQNWDEISQEQILDDIIDKTESKIRELEDVLIVAKFYKEYKISDLMYSPFDVRTTEELADAIRNKPTMEETLNEPGRFMDDEMINILKSFGTLSEDYIYDGSAMESVDNLARFIKDELKEDNVAQYLFALSVAVFMDEEFAEYLDSETHEGFSELLSLAVFCWQLKNFGEAINEYELSKNTAKLFLQKKYDNDEVKAAVQYAMVCARKWIGTETYEDLMGYMSGMRYLASKDSESQDAEDFFDEMMEAMEYYHTNDPEVLEEVMGTANECQ